MASAKPLLLAAIPSVRGSSKHVDLSSFLVSGNKALILLLLQELKRHWMRGRDFLRMAITEEDVLRHTVLRAHTWMQGQMG